MLSYSAVLAARMQVPFPSPGSAALEGSSGLLRARLEVLDVSEKSKPAGCGGPERLIV